MNNLTETLSQLHAACGHDAKANELIDQLSSYLRDNEDVILIEKTINDQIAATFSFEHASYKDFPPAKHFMEMFNRAAVQIAYAMTMAELASCDATAKEYLSAKLNDIIAQGNFGRITDAPVPMTVPTVFDIEAEATKINNIFTPVIELSERMSTLMAQKPILNRSRAGVILKSRKDQQARAMQIISEFDEAAEEEFAADLMAKIAIERNRLSQFVENGLVDETVEVGSMFHFYEDQLTYNIQTLEAALAVGSVQKQQMMRAKNDLEQINKEIAELEAFISANSQDAEQPDPTVETAIEDGEEGK